MENVIKNQTVASRSYAILKRANLDRFPNHPFAVQEKLLTPKGKYRKEKLIHNYVFKTIDEANNYYEKQLNAYLSYYERKEKEKQAKKVFNSNIVASEHFKVGDIIVNTWGWEQTNTEFYQITEVKNKMIVVRAIYQKDVDGSHDFMCCDVMPDINNFIEDGHFARTYNLRLKSSSNGDIMICNPKSFYYFHKWSGKAQYSSHYA
jgi:hypothetical protein